MKDQFTPQKDSNYTQELRSNKASNIIGPMPSRLIRYGITIICLSLVCVIVVSSFLPYRKVVTGVAYLNNTFLLDSNDSIQVNAQLKFDAGSNTTNIKGCKIVCTKAGYEAKGIVESYVVIKTKQEDTKVDIKFQKNANFKHFENTEVNFKIIVSETPILNKLLSTIKVKMN